MTDYIPITPGQARKELEGHTVENVQLVMNTSNFLTFEVGGDKYLFEIAKKAAYQPVIMRKRILKRRDTQ